MSGPLMWTCIAAAALTAPSVQRAVPRLPSSAGLALVLDLAAAGLRSGRPLAAALTGAAPAAPAALAAELMRVAALDGLGAAPSEAWSGLPREGPLGEIARTAERSAASGLKLAAGFERLATDIRADAAAAAAARAQRAAVLAVGPLAACFLPAFICLGVIPVVAGIGREVLSGVSASGLSP